ncbi:3' exoribonuclease family, domain 1-domain-containing protein [Dioszegia hungarica]|uniref:3' exoribonuclease family, domain 1-domain-containing protein n=1 Tax=Dioszegia hungarica TaxID=4972 RepID=A0AA38LST1_9TREE|nr:3' exoribonuclease family, domain 1-domain-containing protein [Dioszegia hungarica]KAI9636177.1 3' exoribonuclease family, domain 1-domain-containing protein [Dioszegia hungarica]
MSTFDRRRIQAPESSSAPAYQQENDAGPSRAPTAPGDISDHPVLKTGLINQANGSAYIESGSVKIACSVYGPRPKAPPFTPRGSLNLELKFAPFASHPRRAPMRDTEPAALSALLTQLILPSLHLHLLPKSSVDVFLMVLESDDVSDLLGAAHTVATAAIADAGIAMSGLGVGTVVRGQEGEAEEGGKGAPASSVTLGVLPALNKVTNVWMTGVQDIDAVCDMIDQGVVSAKATHTVLAQALLEGAEQRGL